MRCEPQSWIFSSDCTPILSQRQGLDGVHRYPRMRSLIIVQGTPNIACIDQGSTVRPNCFRNKWALEPRTYNIIIRGATISMVSLIAQSINRWFFKTTIEILQVSVTVWFQSLLITAVLVGC